MEKESHATVKIDPKPNVTDYIDNLNPLEKIAYDIAVARLKTSFDIEKSIGFKSKKSK
jgi:hypothetical protein